MGPPAFYSTQMFETHLLPDFLPRSSVCSPVNPARTAHLVFPVSTSHGHGASHPAIGSLKVIYE